MLKLLLSHWQAHREPLPFVLTDDPLYCSHLATSTFPEVYSVNRVNPIFEEDEETHKEATLRSASENETRASSEDTGYSSSDHLKSLSTEDAGSLRVRQMSSDSDDSSPIVVVSADVHRVSHPDDVIVLTSSSNNSSRRSLSGNSLSSRYGSELSSSHQEQSFFDSLTMSSLTDNSHDRSNGEVSSQTEVKRPLHSNKELREKLKKLLEGGNNGPTFEVKQQHQTDSDIERTKNDLMKSLSRALHNKVPKSETEVISPVQHATVTRTDSALVEDNPVEQQIPKHPSLTRSSYAINKTKLTPVTAGITRQDESTTSSSSSSSKRNRKQRPLKHHQNHVDKDSRRDSKSESTLNSLNSHRNKHKCKLCDNTNRPMAFHQLLPGHWSYDNVYLPQMSNICYHCYHHHPHVISSSDDSNVFYQARARHSWAPYTGTRLLHDKAGSANSSSKDGQTTSSGTRYSPDGTSHDTDSSQNSNGVKRTLQERRSLRVPKKCKCDDCLASVLDKDVAFPDHSCSCYCLSDRRVKFASESDLSQQRHLPIFHSVLHLGKDKLAKGEPLGAAFVMNLPHLNGHALKSLGTKENGTKSNKVPPHISRGLKEPIKMDELYRTYPINFRDWEAHYRRTYLKKRKKRALTMVGMAIGIILVVGAAIAMTFIFLRIKRPA